MPKCFRFLTCVFVTLFVCLGFLPSGAFANCANFSRYGCSVYVPTNYSISGFNSDTAKDYTRTVRGGKATIRLRIEYCNGDVQNILSNEERTRSFHYGGCLRYGAYTVADGHTLGYMLHRFQEFGTTKLKGLILISLEGQKMVKIEYVAPNNDDFINDFDYMTNSFDCYNHYYNGNSNRSYGNNNNNYNNNYSRPTYQSNKDSAIDHYNQGLIYASQNDYQAAIAEYTIAIQLDPDMHEAYNNRGAMHNKMGDRDSALADYSVAISIKPLSMYYKNRGGTYVRMENYAAAVQDYAAYLEQKPNDAIALNDIAVYLCKLQRYAEALPYVDRAVRLKPNHAAIIYTRGFCYLKIGKDNEALADFTKSYELDHSYTKAKESRDIVRNKLSKAKTI